MNYLKRKKVREGVVVSDKMDKTVVVLVETRKVHPLYRKPVRVTKKYKAHDEHNACRIGDKVTITETRPLSKDKSWRITAIIPDSDKVGTRPEQKQ
jgi:small subunit ribosomal protein S17